MAPGSCWCLQHVLAAPLMFYPPLLQGCDGNRPPGVHAAFPPPDWQALGAPNCTSAVGSTVWEPCKHVLELQACSVPLPHCHPFSLSLVCDFRKALATPRLAVKAFCYMCSLFQHVSCRQEFLLSGPAAWLVPLGSRRKAVSSSGARHLLAALCSHAMPQQERWWAAWEQGFVPAQLRCRQGQSWPEDAHEAHGTNADPAGGQHRARDQQQGWNRRVFTLLCC